MGTPYNAQVSTCESALSFDGSLNSTSNSEAMLLDHEYADPVELKNSIRVEMDKIDRKKKQNLIYESTAATQPCKVGVNKSRSRCSLRNWCVVFVFVISSCALALSLLVTLGIVTTKSLEDDDDVPEAKKIIGVDSSNNDREKMIKELKSKVDKIPDLMKELANLKTKLDNLTLAKGPKGDRGPPGAGDLSKCEYKKEGGTVSFNREHPDKTESTTGKVFSDENFTIVGATCSTLGGAEYGLVQIVRRDRRYFWCKCAGKSSTPTFSNFDLECHLHYWICPTKS